MTAERPPTFSVVMPVRNREHQVAAAIGSVLAQTLDEVELLVVDDGSSDRTRDVVESHADVRVRYLHQEHAGVCSARNLGASAARGRLLTFLDSDDEALPGWLDWMAATFDTTGCDVVVCGALDVDPSRRRWTPVLPESWGPAFDDLPGPFLAGTFAMRIEVFHALDGYEPRLTYSENTELALRLAAARRHSGWTVERIDEPLVVHYQRAVRRYPRGRYDAARFILEHHAERLALDPRAEGLYRGIAGIGAAGLGRRVEACRELAKAVRADPRRLVHYRRLAQVAVLPRLRDRSESAPADEAGNAPTPPPTGRLHALAVTYRRPEELRRTLAAVRRPEHGLATVTVVDNDPARSALTVMADLGGDVDYLATGENLGPAGGLAAGMEHLNPSLGPHDWVVLIDDDDPPPDDLALRDLHDFAGWLLGRGVPVGVVGISGGRLDRRRARFTRVRQRELHGPVAVDFIGGNQFPTVSAAAIRHAGPFRRDLFFGFDDLEFGLRSQRHGFAVLADGGQWVRARARAGRTGDVVPAPPRRTSAWRRYYSIRNLIVVLRDEVGIGAAVVATVTNVLGRPLVDVRSRRPEWRRYAVVGVRAGVDAWRRRMGRRVDPGSG